MYNDCYYLGVPNSGLEFCFYHNPETDELRAIEFIDDKWYYSTNHLSMLPNDPYTGHPYEGVPLDPFDTNAFIENYCYRRDQSQPFDTLDDLLAVYDDDTTKKMVDEFNEIRPYHMKPYFTRDFKYERNDKVKSKYELACSDFIYDKLPDLEGQEIDVDDLFYILTEDINNTGSVYCNRPKALQDLTEWELDDGSVTEFEFNYECDFGEKPSERYNPMTVSGTEPYHTMMVMFGVEQQLLDTEWYYDHTGETVKITDKDIQEIRKDLGYQVEQSDQQKNKNINR